MAEGILEFCGDDEGQNRTYYLGEAILTFDNVVNHQNLVVQTRFENSLDTS